MRQFTESEQTELVDLFRGIYEADDKVAALKESMKQYTDSRKEMVKKAAEKLECRPIAIKRAYKEWVARIENREESEEIDDIVVFLQEFVEGKIK